MNECCIMLDGQPFGVDSPPQGRFLERRVRGGPECWVKRRYERVSGRPWFWRLIEETDITESMWRARMEQFSDVLRGIWGTA